MDEQIPFCATDVGKPRLLQSVQDRYATDMLIIEYERLLLCLSRCVLTTFDDLIAKGSNVCEHARIIG